MNIKIVATLYWWLQIKFKITKIYFKSRIQTVLFESLPDTIALAVASPVDVGLRSLFCGKPFASDGCLVRICNDRFDVEPPVNEYSFLHVSHLALLVLPSTGLKNIQMLLRFPRNVEELLSAMLTKQS